MKRKIALALAAVMSVTSFAGFSVSANSSLITRTLSSWSGENYVIGEDVVTTPTSGLTLNGVPVANRGEGTSYEIDFSTRAAVNGARFSLSLDKGGVFGYGYATGLLGTGKNSNVANATTSRVGTYAEFKENTAFDKLYTTGMTKAELVLAGTTAATLTGDGKAFTENFIFDKGTPTNTSTTATNNLYYDADITYSPAATVKAKSGTTRALTVQDVYNAALLNEATTGASGDALEALGNYFGTAATDVVTTGGWTTGSNIYFDALNGTTHTRIAATKTAIEAYITGGGSSDDVVYAYNYVDGETGDSYTISTAERYVFDEDSSSEDSAIYTLYVPSTEKSKMYVTFPYGTTTSDVVSVPLAFRIGDTSDVTTLTVDAMTSGISGLGTSYKLTANLTGTTLSVSKATGKDTISLNDITVKEDAPGVFKAKQYIELYVTDYYRLTGGKFTSSVLGASDTNGFVGDGFIYTSLANARTAVGVATDAALTTEWTENSDKAAVAYYTSTARDNIRIYFNPAYNNSGMVASITLTEGILAAEIDHEPITGDIVTITVENDGMGSVTDASAEIAEFTELGIGYSAATAKSVRSGTAGVEAAKVTIQENLLNAWTSSRRTELSLVDKDGNLLEDVKFTSIGNDGATNISGTYTASNKGVEGGLNSGNMYFNEAGNVVTFTNLTITDKKLAKLVVVPNLSAAPGFEGDVYLKIGGTAVSGENLGNSGIVHIATFTQRAVITAKSMTIPANTTSYTVGDIVLTENHAGTLASGNVINIGFVDADGNTTTDVRFKGVTNSNITVDGVRATLANNADGTLTITIDRASSTAGSITLSDLGVTVKSGLTSGVYNIVVNGNAIVRNVDEIRNVGYTDLTTSAKRTNTNYWRDTFDTVGYTVENYVLIGTSGEKAALDMTVVYTSGSAVVVANGETYDMTLAPVNVNGSLFVPVRYTLTPYGIDAEKNVVWDAVTSTAFITVGDTRVEFVSGSSVYRVYVNGSLTNIVEMVDANGAVVKSQIIDGRMFVPVRQFANAFGLTTDWDATSGEATFTLAK